MNYMSNRNSASEPDTDHRVYSTPDTLHSSSSPPSRPLDLRTVVVGEAKSRNWTQCDITPKGYGPIHLNLSYDSSKLIWLRVFYPYAHSFLREFLWRLTYVDFFCSSPLFLFIPLDCGRCCEHVHKVRVSLHKNT